MNGSRWTNNDLAQFKWLGHNSIRTWQNRVKSVHLVFVKKHIDYLHYNKNLIFTNYQQPTNG